MLESVFMFSKVYKAGSAWLPRETAIDLANKYRARIVIHNALP